MAIYNRLKRLGKEAGVTVSPHALRRCFVTLNANKGRPLQMLKHACGHSDIKTTMGYCMTTEQEVIEAMKEWEVFS
jgi:integrase